MRKTVELESAPFVRDLDAGYFFEIFLVSAVASILVTRLFLHLTGNMQLAPGNLHIAHVLWGGLLMMVAMIMLLGFLGKSIKYFSAFVGGVGFGIFVDELGKFLTRDNDYWFQPTIALIYVIFVLLFLAFRFIHRYNVVEREYLVNGLEMLKEAVLADMDEEEKTQALQYLEKGNGRFALAKQLYRFVEKRPPDDPSRFRPYRWFKYVARIYYRRLISVPHFATFVIGFFVLNSLWLLFWAIYRLQYGALGPLLIFLLVFLVTMIIRKFQITSRFSRVLFLIGAVFGGYLIVSRIMWGVEYPALLFAEWGETLSSLVSGMFVLIGVSRFKRSRLVAYRYFKTALLVTIFLTQFFIFYLDRFAALPGLAIGVLTLLILDYMISQEAYLQKAR